MHHPFLLASRILAGLIGFGLFYLALFMYEDEAGRWQSRLDSLWITVLERSKLTESTTVALFNKTAEVVLDAVIRVFGPKFFSVRTMITAVNLSLIGPLIADLFLMPLSDARHIGLTYWDYILFDIVPLLLLFVCAFARLFSEKMWAVVISYFPIVFVGIVMPLFSRVFYHEGGLGYFVLTTCVVVISALLTVYATFTVLVTFIRLGQTLSFWRLIWLLLYPLVVCIVVLVYPTLVAFMISAVLIKYDLLKGMERQVVGFPISLFSHNIGAAIFCLFPMFSPLLVILHRLTWPILPRLLSPLKRFKIMTNTPALLSVGGFCLVFAFKLKETTWADFIALFGGK